MTFQREKSLVGVHPTPVVLHPQIGFTSVSEFDLNLGRTRINAILDQLLNHRHGPFHHLAGSNLIGYPVWKYSNFRHAFFVTPGPPLDNVKLHLHNHTRIQFVY